MSRRALLMLLFCLSFVPLHAQDQDGPLSYPEVEKLREAAIFPEERVLILVDFLNVRTREIDTLLVKPRRPGREQDIHDFMEQFNNIAEQLQDNLDDYGKRHRDIRKALPKVLAATERWATALKSPAENSTYNVARKLALETVVDLHDQTTQLIEEQKSWFALHPPSKSKEIEVP